MKLPSCEKSKLAILYLPKVICNHIIGSNHNHVHRIAVGIILMVLGVEIAKIGSEIHFIACMIDAGGYTLHAIGAVPIIEWLLKFRE